MTYPLFHARSSVRCFGGSVENYLAIHEWLDATKETFCDFRHRALRHHSQGVFEAERVFGITVQNSDGRVIPVPSVSDWLSRIRPESWMSRGYVLPVEGDSI